jgi:hypothetical protein
MPEPSIFELEMAIEKLRRYKSQGIDQIPAELIKAGCKNFALRAINLLILFGIRRNCLRSGMSRSLNLFIRRTIKHIVVFIELSATYIIVSSILLSMLTPYSEEFTGDHQCGFRRNISTTDYTFCIPQILEKKLEYNEAVHELLVDFKDAYNSFTMEVLHNILSEFGIPTKIIRLLEMSKMFPIKNCLKQGDALSPLPLNFALEYAVKLVQVN